AGSDAVSASERERNAHSGFDSNRDAVDDGWLVLPLLDGADCGLIEHRYGLHDAGFLDVAVGPDDYFDIHIAFNMPGFGNQRIVRPDVHDALRHRNRSTDLEGVE